MASPKSALDVQGLDYNWLGHDEDGHVALFSTAGGGYPPKEFLRDTEAPFDAIQEIRAAAATTVAVLFPEIKAARNQWREVAERGLYAYDSDFFGGPYVVIAVPSVPRRMDALPARVRAVSIRCGFRFMNTSVVTDEMLEPAGRDALDHLKARILANRFVDRVRCEFVNDDEAYAELCSLLRKLAQGLDEMDDIDRKLALTLYCIPQMIRNAFLACPPELPMRASLEDRWVELDALVMDCFGNWPR